MDRWLERLAGLVTAYPRRVLLVALLATALVATQIAGLRISTSRTALVAEDDPHWVQYMRFAHEFGMPEDLVLVAEAREGATVHGFLDRVFAELPEPLRAASFYRVDFEQVRHQAPYFLEADALAHLRRLAGSAALADFRNATDAGARLAALARVLDEQSGSLGGLVDTARAEELAGALQFVLGELDRVAAEPERPLRLVDPDAAYSGAVAALGRGGLDPKGYLTAREGRLGVMLVRPSYTRDEMDVVVPFVNEVRAAVERARAAHAEVTYGLTGLPAQQIDELTTIQHDSQLTSLISIAFVVILFLLYYPTLRVLGITLFVTLVGGIWTTAAVNQIFGYLNLMSSIFLVVLIGIGTDFSVHIAARFFELRTDGRTPAEAARDALRLSGRGIATAAVTSAVAFLSVAFSGFKGIEELGVASAIALFASLVASFVLGPALLALLPVRFQSRQQGFPAVSTIVGRLLDYRRAVVATAIVTTAPLAIVATSLEFDYSLLNLLPERAESAAWMRALASEPDLSGFSIAAVAPTLEEARALEARFRELPTVHRAVSAASFLPSHQEDTLGALKEIAARLDEARRSRPPPPAGTIEDGVRALTVAVEDLQALAFQGQAGKTVDRLEEALASLGALEAKLAGPDAERARRGVSRAMGEAAAELERAYAILGEALTHGPLTPSDLPKNLRGRFHSEAGRFAVYAIPKESIWEHDALGRFLAEARGVHPAVTGFPETFYENSGRIRAGFADAALYAILAVFALVWLDLRRLRLALLAMVPVAFGSAWMLGALALLGSGYNLANIIAVPLLIGLGVDFGVHLVHRTLQERNVATATLHTGGAVVLSALTTISAFGSLAFASHKGYQSLGIVLFVGVGACLVAAITLLPALMASRRSFE